MTDCRLHDDTRAGLTTPLSTSVFQRAETRYQYSC